MKWPFLILAGAGVVGAVTARPSEEPWTVLVGGDTAGYLAPCGCTKPMTGGIRRRAAAIKALSVPDRTLVIDSGNLSGGNDRQSVLKAEAMADALRSIKVDAILLSRRDASMGRGIVGNLSSLSGDRFLTGALRSDPALPIEPVKYVGPFTIGGYANYTGTDFSSRSVPEAEVIGDIASGSAGVVMIDGTEADAKRIAKAHPTLQLIVYRRQGAPTVEPIKVGNTWLVSPGEKGKHLIRLHWKDGNYSGYQVVPLGPEFEDEPKTSAIYLQYLNRVAGEDLLGKMARTVTDAFAGSATCGTCHAKDYEVWKKTAHAGALKTLEEDHHDRDPDCVSCHVVGLESTVGFVSRAKTPDLADVGCESCHGPGRAHSLEPLKVKMPNIGPESCAKCHVPDHSPGFEFLNRWPQIAHGMGKTRG